ncbi:MAG: glycosyltransferase family 39 protein [Candidatus Aenigmarchaeota archaeon]|nr:glycosyltransferase family 39 protein [Candidatus Aenigmarchaeota archaeon]
MELQVTLPNPITFGDEAFHTGMARYIAKEKDYPGWVTIEGTEAGRNHFGKPPLLHLLEAGFFLIFGFNETIVKILLPFISLLTALAIYILVKKIYDDKIAFIAAIVFISIPSVATYAVTFYTEGLVTFYFALSVLLFIYSLKTENKKYLFLTGMFVAFAFLTEVSSVNLIIFILLAALYDFTRSNFQISRYAILFTAFIIVTSGFFVRNLSVYHAPECYLPFTNKIFDTSGCDYGNTIREQKYQYQAITAGGGSDQSVYGMGITNFLDFAYGNIWLVVLGVFGGIVISLYRRDVTSILLLLISFTFIIYFNFTTSRAEDAARNLLAWTPIFGVLTGIYFGRLYELLQSYQKYIALVIFIVVILLAYQNLTPKLDVMKQVKQFSQAFFEACDWVRNNLPNDVLLSTVWVHRAAYSCERPVVGNPPDIFLSKDLELIKKDAKSVGITHLFIQKFSLSNEAISERYEIDSVLFFEGHNETFVKVYENGPPLQQCIQQGGCDGNIIYEIKF